MSIPVEIRDAKTGNEQRIDDSGASLNIVKPIPPYKPGQRMKVFRQHLTDDGLPTDGTNQDMRVNGSSTNVDFYVEADPEKDRYISRLSFVIADNGAANNQFGAISALTNGCLLQYEDEEEVVTIHEALKTNFNFVRLCSGNPAFGATTNTFRASNVSGNSEAYIPVLDLRDTFGFQWGLLLKAGSTQRITLRVRDNITAIDQFDCIAYGFERSQD